MRSRTRLLTPLALAAVLATAACGESGSSGTSDSSGGGAGGAASGDACAPVAGDQLVVLEDDQQLQNADNVVPAVNAAAAGNPALLETLNSVSAVLTTDDLIEMNAAVDVERQSATDVAAAYVSEQGLTGSGGSGPVVVILHKQGNGDAAEGIATPDAEETLTALEPVAEQAGLVFGEPAEAADQNAFAVTTEFADALGVTTLSELADACGDGSLVLGGPGECPERPQCQPGLEDSYGLTFASFSELDAGGPLTKAAIQQGEVSIGLVFSSDGALAQG